MKFIKVFIEILPRVTIVVLTPAENIFWYKIIYKKSQKFYSKGYYTIHQEISDKRVKKSAKSGKNNDTFKKKKFFSVQNVKKNLEETSKSNYQSVHRNSATSVHRPFDTGSISILINFRF